MIILKKIYKYFYFIIISYFSRLKISKIVNYYDRLSPLNFGEKNSSLLLNGYKQYNDMDSEDVKSLYHAFRNDLNFINSKEMAIIFNKIFFKIFDDIKSYIGEDSRLEFVKFQHTQKNINSISENWHTDNVGIRLKCYICLDGDGTQPTLIISQFKNKYTPNFTEELRYLGFKNLNDKSKQISLNHKTNSVFIFDTNYLHRGGYDKTDSSRTALVMEFSNYKKTNAILEKNYLIPIPLGKQNCKIKFGPIFLNNFNYNDTLMNYLKEE